MLLLDNSAWARLQSAALDEERAEQVARWLEGGELATCLPFLLEAGYSARSADDRERMMRDLGELPRIELTSQIEQSAVDAQADLARVGHHRVAPSDLVIAACAHHAGADVLHYDHDYDTIQSKTRLDFESEWLAPPGSL